MRLFFEERLAIFAVIACGIIGALCWGYVRHPAVFLMPWETEREDVISVLVSGAVEFPGEYRLSKGNFAEDAAQTAVLKPEADAEYLVSKIPLVDGEVVYVPRRGESALEAETEREGLLKKWRQPYQLVPFDLNRAAIEEMATVPGVGKKLATAIMLRRKREPFRSVDDLKSVAGIGKKKYERIKDYFVVGEGED